MTRREEHSFPAGSRVTMRLVGSVAVIEIDNPPVNVGDAEVRRGLLAAFLRLPQEATSVVVTGRGRHFMAGSDLREFENPELPGPVLPEVQRAMRDSSPRIIAAIRGLALGGGFELALACDARIATPDAVVGLPETTLGIVPGAGGTQILPRLAGRAVAIEIVCSGRRIGAPEAKALGLLDDIVDASSDDELVAAAIEHAERRTSGARRRTRDVSRADTDAAVEAAAAAARRDLRRRPWLEHAITLIESAPDLDLDEGLKRERATFEDLRTSADARALRHLFFAERAAVGRSSGPARIVEKVAVVGAGTMGLGVAAACAAAQLPVTLLDVDPMAIERGLAALDRRYAAAVTRGRLTSGERARRQDLIRGSSELSDVSTADVVVEAIIEDLPAKQALFGQLDRIVTDDCVLATNTSYLRVADVTAPLRRATHALGLHFFAPADVNRLVEVVPTARTSPESVATALAFARRLGKVPITVQDVEGFLGNRLYGAYRRQCEYLLEEGAMPHDVDGALEDFGFALGPFAVADLSGLDIAWRQRRRQRAIEPPQDPAVRQVEIADRLCEAGRLGQKTGAGWYRYEGRSRTPIVDPAVSEIVVAHARGKGIRRRAIAANEIVERALLATVAEGQRALDAGIARSVSDIDLVMVTGFGFPRRIGGPMHWAAAQVGEDLRRRLEHVEALSRVESLTRTARD